MKVRPSFLGVFVLVAAPLAAQDRRVVTEPVAPPACVTLEARLEAPLGRLSDDDESRPDTGRIQAAIDACPSGRSVRLTRRGAASVFLSGPLRLKAGVTLVVEAETALFGSRDPRDYDAERGSCGILAETGKRGAGCKPLLLAEDAPGSGVMGRGAIDGRGGAVMRGQELTWWELAKKAKVLDLQQTCPRLLVVRRSNGFTLAGLTLRNSPNFHVVAERTDGFTAWGVKIKTPKTARNSDGIDPSSSTNVTIAHCLIDTGDDDVAIKAGGTGPTTHVTIAHNRFWNGHGLSIGSNTNGGVRAVRVTDLTIDGADNGLRIKSDRSRGGLVEDVAYEDVCMRNVPNPIVLTSMYTTLPGELLPVYRDIRLKDVHSVDGGWTTLLGLDAEHRVGVLLDNVHVDGQRNEQKAAAHADVRVGPRRGSFSVAGSDTVSVDDAGAVAGDPPACEGRFAPFPDLPEAPAAAVKVPDEDSTLYVAASGSGDYWSIQRAIDVAPPDGAVISVAPGTYRERLVVTKPNIRIRSPYADASRTVIAPSVEVRAPGFQLENVTVGAAAASTGASDDPRQAQAKTAPAAAFPVAVRVDARADVGEMRPIWRFFGYDEPNFTYMKDGQRLLGELSKLGPHQVFIRTHHLLTSGSGAPALKWGSTNAYREDAQGRPVYDWTIVDRIFDTLLARGAKPFVEIGFMPEALSTRPDIYPHDPPPNERAPVDGGQAYPPKDYDKWRALCQEWVKHSVGRYGRAEVETWWWEVWNEPNIRYWNATPEEYHKLYDYAVDGVRRALPTARVGGPHTAGGPGGTFLRDFLEHCLRGRNHATGGTGAPLDFVGFHAKGAPKFEDGRVVMGIAEQLDTTDAGFATVAAFPELRQLPIVIGEFDPEGCAACQGPQLGYRNGTMYSSYTAASFARTYALADKHGVNLEGALTWAFEFESQPWFAGFRVLSTNGVDMPVLNAFRMLGRMGGRRLGVTSGADPGVEAMRRAGVRGRPDVSALASLDGRRLCVLLWHYHDDDVAGPDADVALSLEGLPYGDGRVRVRHYRVDREHGNAFERWKRMGSPPSPTPEQQAELAQAGQLAEIDPVEPVEVRGGKTVLRLTLPRQAVSLLVVEPGSAASAAP
jgi:xylan 1,4-beta-xylosidase